LACISGGGIALSNAFWGARPLDGLCFQRAPKLVSVRLAEPSLETGTVLNPALSIIVAPITVYVCDGRTKKM